ncbi:TPA: hypothetical protein ACGGS8_002795 [Vibrio cholerae]
MNYSFMQQSHAEVLLNLLKQTRRKIAEISGDGAAFWEGFIAINLEFWEEESLRKHFAYSEESTTRIVFNIESKMYEIVDKVSWDKLYEFDNFIEALSFNLEDCCIF